ncbi:hypothetical protein [Cupriavidus necator]
MTAQIARSDIERWEAERKADREWEKWRKRAARRLPDLASRVFALNGKPYNGGGGHYAMVRSLGRMITEVGDPTRSPFEREQRWANRLITQVAFEGLHADLREAERSAMVMADSRAGGSHAG